MGVPLGSKSTKLIHAERIEVACKYHIIYKYLSVVYYFETYIKDDKYMYNILRALGETAPEDGINTAISILLKNNSKDHELSSDIQLDILDLFREQLLVLRTHTLAYITDTLYENTKFMFNMGTVLRWYKSNNINVTIGPLCYREIKAGKRFKFINQYTDTYELYKPSVPDKSKVANEEI